MKHFLSCTFLFICLSCTIFHSFGQIVVRSLNRTNGLSTDVVYCSYFDKQGFLWMGTATGIVRYDGMNLLSYSHIVSDTSSLLLNQVNCFNEIGDDLLLIGLAGKGISTFNKNTNSFSHPLKNVIKDDLYNVFAIFVENDSLVWLANHLSVDIWNIHTGRLAMRQINHRKWSNSLMQDKSDPSIIWIGSIDGLYKYDLKLHTLDSLGGGGFDLRLANNKILTLSQQNDLIAIGHEGAGVTLYFPKSKLFKHLMFGNSKDLVVRGISFINDSIIWISPLCSKIIKYNLTTDQSTLLKLSPKNSDDSEYCTWKMEFRKDQLWLSTLNKGLTQIAINESRIQKVEFKNNLKNKSSFHSGYMSVARNHYVLKDDHNNLWIYDTSFQFISKAKTGLNKISEFEDYYKTIDYSFDSVLFYGSGVRIININTGQGRTIIAKPDKNEIYTSGVKIKDNLCLASISYGLSIYDLKNEKWLIKRFDSLGTDIKQLIPLKVKDKSNDMQMLVVYNDCVIYFSLQEGVLKCNKIINQGFGIGEKLFIRSANINERENKIYLGSYDNGLYVFKNTNDLWVLFNEYSKRTGYDLYTIDAISESNNRIWFVSNSRLLSLDESTNIIYRDDTQYDLNNFEYTNSLLIQNDKLIVPDINGFRVQCVASQDSNNKKPLIITGVFINFSDNNLLRLMHDQIFEFNSNERNINFTFSTMDFANTAFPNTYYRLLPNENWTKLPASKNEVNFNDLQAGSYEFHIKSGTSIDNKFESIKFRIKPKWHESNLFYLAIICIISAIIIAFTQSRINSIRSIYHTRQSISHDLHDEVGSTITSINLLSAISLDEIEKKPGSAKQHIGAIQTQAKSLQHVIKDMAWIVQSGTILLKDFSLKLKEIAVHLIEPSQILFDIDITNVHASQIKLESIICKHLIMIYREAINNAIKHSAATKIDIHLELLSGNNLRLLIRDDGIGINANVSKGNGLQNMQYRAQKIKADLKIDATIKGTSIYVMLAIR